MSEHRRFNDTLELTAAILLAAATTASAWCAYQSALWSGEQTEHLAVANAAHFESLRLNADGNMKVAFDAATLINYIITTSRGDTQAAEFLRTHARPGFRPVLNSWIEKHKHDPDAEVPFKPPDYNLKEKEEAEKYSRMAGQATLEANAANSHGDLFVLHTVLFALSMFFLGWTPQAHHPRMRVAMLTFGALICVLTFISVVRMPRTQPESRRPKVELPGQQPRGSAK